MSDEKSAKTSIWCPNCEDEHEIEIPASLKEQIAKIGDKISQVRKVTIDSINELKNRGFTPENLPVEQIMEAGKFLTHLYHLKFLATTYCDKFLEQLYGHQIEAMESFLQMKNMDPIRNIALFMYGVQVQEYQSEAEEELLAASDGKNRLAID